MLLATLSLTLTFVSLAGLGVWSWSLKRELKQIRREIARYQQGCAGQQPLAQAAAHRYFVRRFAKKAVQP